MTLGTDETRGHTHPGPIAVAGRSSDMYIGVGGLIILILILVLILR